MAATTARQSQIPRSERDSLTKHPANRNEYLILDSSHLAAIPPLLHASLLHPL